MKNILIKIQILLFLILLSSFVKGQWISNQSINNTVYTGANDDELIETINGNRNEVITVFNKNGKVLAQKINAFAQTVWGNVSNAILVTDTTNNNNTDFFVCSDSLGGFLIVWIENNNKVKVQRVDSLGNQVFGYNGLQLNLGTSFNLKKPFVTVNESKKIYVGWTEYSNVNETAKIKIQLINLNGNLLFSVGGRTLNTNNYLCRLEGMVTSFTDLILVYADNRELTTSNYYNFINYSNSPIPNGGNVDIIAQKIDSNGVQLWNSNGLQGKVVSTIPGFQALINQKLFNGQDGGYNQNIISDNNGGVILGIYDYNFSDFQINYRLFTQKITKDGLMVWNGGQPVEVYTNFGRMPGLSALKYISDRNGNTIFIFGNNGFLSETFAEKISNNGVKQWNTKDFNMGTGLMNRDIESDDIGNIYYAYQLVNNNVPFGALGIQKILPNGSLSWLPNIKLVCTNNVNSLMHSFLTKTDSNKIIITWSNARNNFNQNDIFTSRVEQNGSISSSSTLNLVNSLNNGLWTDPLIWPGGLFPNENTNVVVTHNIIISADAICKSLTVVPPATITIKPGVNFIIKP